jgi:hypothetical protein
MGAQEFTITKSGWTMKEAYNRAIEDSIDEYGHQEGYSGTIASTSELRDITAEFDSSNKTPNKFIEDKLESCPKWMCYAICTKKPKQNKSKVKSKVEHIVNPGTKKWILNYVVRNDYEDYIGAYRTKGEALKAARKYTEETKWDTVVNMEKVLYKCDTKVAKIKYKKDTKEEPGIWTFFGVASC